MKPARILYVSHTAALSGAELSLLSLMTSLDRSRFEPLALLPGEGPFSRRLASAGIAIEAQPLAPASVRSPGGILRTSRLLRSIIRACEIALVHANSFHAIKQAAALRRLGGPPLVGHLRDIVPFTRLTRAAIRSCDRVICVSRAAEENLEGGAASAPGGRVRVIPNGVDERLFSALPDRRSALAALGLGGHEGPAVGIAAPLVRWKGHHLFLQAARLVLREIPDALFLIAGGPEFAEPGYVDELRAAAGAPPLDGRVRFLGFVDRIQDLLAALDILVCASIEPDPLPRAVLEAMAAGRPVVAAATGGLPEIVVEGETGRLVPPRDPEAMARAITALLRDEAARSRMGRAGAGRAVSHFSLRAHATRVMSLYEELLPR